MIEEKALLHFNKFKALRKQIFRDTLRGHVYELDKVKMHRKENGRYDVILFLINQMTNETIELDSEYGNNYLRET